MIVIRVWCLTCLLVFVVLSGLTDAKSDDTSSTTRYAQVALTGMLETLDPAIGYDWTNFDVIRAFFDGLLALEPKTNRPTLNLAKSYTLSSDKRTHTFVLHPHVRFHNGRELIAEDVKYSLERITHPTTNSPGRGFFRMIEGYEDQANGTASGLSGIKVLGRYQVSIRTTQPDATLPFALAINFGAVVPQEEVAKKSFDRYPIGSGPFKVDRWTDEGHLIVTRNTDYFVPGLPKVAGITFLTKQSVVQSMARLERGEIDLLGKDNEIENATLIRARTDVRYHNMTRKYGDSIIGTTYVSINTQRPPLDQRAVRQALNYAIDKKSILNLFEGNTLLATQILPPGFPSHEPKYTGYAYDPSRAKQLLRQAGLSKGFESELLTLDKPVQKKIALFLQRDLARIGVYLTIRLAADSQDLLACASNSQCAALVLSEGLGWLADYVEASNFYLPLLSLESAQLEEETWNWAFYSNPEVDRLARQALRLPGNADSDKRVVIWRQAFQKIMTDAPWIPLYHRQPSFVISPFITDRKFMTYLSDYYKFFNIDMESP